MRLVLAAGTTRTASIEGISAAGASPELMTRTPALDAELAAYGGPVSGDRVPVSPTGCPTPAVVTRAVREATPFELTVIDAGLALATRAPTVSIEAAPGADIREPEPVPRAGEIFEAAREFGRSLPDDELLVGETIPGGTTTALGVLTALGEDASVSSSLPENPIERKRAVVAEGMDASGVAAGDLAGTPREALRRMGDPVLATVAGLTVGALQVGTRVTLAGGTQLLTAAALVRHAGVEDDLALATTSFVAADPNVDLHGAAADFGVDPTVTDPGFDAADHVAMARYAAGEGKEGVGMGGALALAARRGVPMETIRERVAAVYERAVADDRVRADDDGRGRVGDEEIATATDPAAGGDQDDGS